MTKIFISYRRDDSKVIAGRIYDYLVPPLGIYEPHDVFKDVDSIPPGVNFKKFLDEQVAKCAIQLVIIGPNWLDARNEDGSRRLDDETDFVRIEIESALKRDIPVIPLLVMGAKMPKKLKLPSSLEELAFRNGVEIRDDPDFRADMGRLKKSLEYWLNVAILPVVSNVPVIQVVQTPSAIASAELAAGTVRKDEKGIEMVYVPAGTFLMGSDRSKDSSTYENELPQHSVTIDNGFWIDKYPVTNIEYDYFVNHNGYHKKDYWTAEGWTWAQSHLGKFKTSNLVIYNKIKHPYLPRIGVTWFEAVAYAKWRDARLPNEAEWEYAARGKDGRIYPHGDVFDANKVVFRDNSEGKPAPVGSKPDGLTWVGALDMIGNVWEWTTTIYDRVRFPYPFAEDGRDNLQGNQVRVLRGGSYSSPPSRLRIAFRYAISSSGAEDINGFRCVRDTLP